MNAILDSIQFNFSLLEVIDENTQRYASMSVSGGELNMAGSYSRIETSVKHHASQTFWVRNLKTGVESQCSAADRKVLAIRPGHILLECTDQNGTLVRLSNLSTQKIQYRSFHFEPTTPNMADVVIPFLVACVFYVASPLVLISNFFQSLFTPKKKQAFADQVNARFRFRTNVICGLVTFSWVWFFLTDRNPNAFIQAHIGAISLLALAALTVNCYQAGKNLNDFKVGVAMKRIEARDAFARDSQALLEAKGVKVA